MIKIEPVEEYDLLEMFGEPGDTSDFVKRPFPFTLYLNGDKSKPCVNFYGNRYIADSVIDAYQEILDIYGLDFIREHNLDEYGGCYNYRKARGLNKLSVHSWALAVDILPSLGKMGEPSRLPYHFVQAFLNRGWFWGGFYELHDSMHFTCVKE